MHRNYIYNRKVINGLLLTQKVKYYSHNKEARELLEQVGNATELINYEWVMMTSKELCDDLRECRRNFVAVMWIHSNLPFND